MGVGGGGGGRGMRGGVGVGKPLLASGLFLLELGPNNTNVYWVQDLHENKHYNILASLVPFFKFNF